ncbi:hypothetical protein G7Y89_g12494 [Cudoniella acicularis]|uniref:Uncharacterized protein n=1 Tax=Cudoniella acicularis TaxID=354080 RepID=A0A8H4RBQ7_9HELO|nr:hypothetical protein G7Y89_g12494 [Cudoniella acicularis]
MANHRRVPSVSHTRLAQSLPPIPVLLSDIPSQTYIPYRDDPEEEEEAERDGEASEQDGGDEQREQTIARPSSPPEYQPMYDYLRSKQLSNPNSQSTSPIVTTVSIPVAAPALEPYRDEPFVVTIESSPPPPSYNDLYREHAIEMANLERSLADDGDPAERTEEIYKWVVGMLLITLTVACVGTAFNWGR